MIQVHFDQTVGKIKPMHGVGQPPYVNPRFKTMHYLKEAGIPYSRLHDVCGAYGGHNYVDVPNIFRDFDADENLPEGKPVFFIYTHGAPKGDFLKAVRKIAGEKRCREIGSYHCTGFDTFGPFKLVGGIAKGHPTEEEISGAAAFYRSL